jgi:hypothetical protein
VRRFLLIRATTLGAALVALSACYTYTALPPSGARTGERVRVRVSGGEAERLEQVVTVRNRAVEGELVEQADSNIALAMPLTGASTEGPSLSQQAQQRIVIPRADVQSLEVRRVDKLRTSVLVGATIVGVAAVAAAKGTTLLGSNGPGNGPNESRVPRGSLAFAWDVSIQRLLGAAPFRSASQNR